MSEKKHTPTEALLTNEVASHVDTLCVSQCCKETIGERMKGQRSLGIPIIQTSSYSVTNIQQFLNITEEGKGYIYGRLSCPTNEEAATIITSLEGGAATLLYSSGMSAVTSAVLALLKAGDHMICCSPCYGGSLGFFKKYVGNYGIEVTFVDPYSGENGVEAYEKAIRDNTKLLYGESPINPNVRLMDLKEFGALGLKYKVITLVDSTFGTPYLQQPIAQYGIDISLHSCTKYLNGHSDLLAGSLTFKSLEIWREVREFSELLGGCLPASSASLLIRGIKTLAVRMERHCQNALQIAKYLESHPKVRKVVYPGLPSHPEFNVAQRQMPKGGGGMIAFHLHGGFEACDIFTSNLKIIHLGVSLGGVESLLCHPATMVHGSSYLTKEQQDETGIEEDMIRFSIGLEHVEDLQRDLEQALAKIQSKKL